VEGKRGRPINKGVQQKQIGQFMFWNGYLHQSPSVDGYHTVKVEAHTQGHRKLTVYTRSGYLSKQSPSRNPKTDMK
jgi:hypothetical protein